MIIKQRKYQTKRIVIQIFYRHFAIDCTNKPDDVISNVIKLKNIISIKGNVISQPVGFQHNVLA